MQKSTVRKKTTFRSERWFNLFLLLKGFLLIVPIFQFPERRNFFSFLANRLNRSDIKHLVKIKIGTATGAKI